MVAAGGVVDEPDQGCIWAARWRSTYCRMPPWATYSTSCGVSTRTIISNDLPLARTVSRFLGVTPDAMPSIEIVSSPVRPHPRSGIV
jgi:hypothetical protein